MGIFWESPTQTPPATVQLFHAAYAMQPPAADMVGQLATNSAAAAVSLSAPTTLNSTRLILALAIVAVLLGAGIWTDQAHLADSSKTLFALATTAFGIVTGLVTGEKSKS